MGYWDAVCEEQAEIIGHGSWGAVCEAVNECDEPPIRRCPRCTSMCYEVPQGTYNCPTCGAFKSEAA